MVVSSDTVVVVAGIVEAADATVEVVVLVVVVVVVIGTSISHNLMLDKWMSALSNPQFTCIKASSSSWLGNNSTMKCFFSEVMYICLIGA